MSKLPQVAIAEKELLRNKRLLLAAYGFEERSLGWATYQEKNGDILTDAVIINYLNPKSKNKIDELKDALGKIGVSSPNDIGYDIFDQHHIETIIEKKIDKYINKYD